MVLRGGRLLPLLPGGWRLPPLVPLVPLVPLLACMVSCAGKDEALGADGRGDDACLNYQDALCDWVVRCNPGVERADCEANASSIVCGDEVQARSCALEIDSADCRVPPDDCELFDLADRAPARRACEAYASEVCRVRVACKQQPADACKAELAALDCGSVVGVKAGYSACLHELGQGACEAVPPESCRDILLAEPAL